ncbi:hypothetical protein CBS147353_11714 [Aspergillus niger]|nr:hypothetical protein CBS147353_11714 [Aspergillus niger]
MAPHRAIAVHTAIAQQQLSPTARRQEASFQTEVRKKVGLMYHQQLQRVDSLEQWQPQLVAQMSSGGTQGADSDHSGQIQAESQQQTAKPSCPATQAHHEGEQNQGSQRVPHNRVSGSSGSNHIRVSRQNHYQKDPDQAIQPTPSNGTSQSTQTNDVSERIQHQDSQRPAIKQEEESQNEEQQQRAPQQTRARNNRRRITDQCLRQGGGLPGAPLGLCLRHQNMSAGEKSLFYRFCR